MLKILSEVGLIVATQAVSYCHYFENRGILLDKYRCYYRPHIDIDIDTFCKKRAVARHAFFRI